MPKKYRVEITATAEADTAAIFDYIARDNPDAATAFILHLGEQLETLERYPSAAPSFRIMTSSARPTATCCSATTGPSSKSPAPW